MRCWRWQALCSGWRIRRLLPQSSGRRNSLRSRSTIAPRLERWQDWADFAAELNRDGERVRFTFFVSGINFLSNAKKHLYQGPNQSRGASRINFGGSADDVRRRVAFINALHRDGHEIASHAVGHFDGRNWGTAAWTSEFNSFDGLLDNVVRNNELSSGERLCVHAEGYCRLPRTLSRA